MAYFIQNNQKKNYYMVVSFTVKPMNSPKIDIHFINLLYFNFSNHHKYCLYKLFSFSRTRSNLSSDTGSSVLLSRNRMLPSLRIIFLAKFILAI